MLAMLAFIMLNYKTLYVYCQKCRFLLFRYKKGGSGSLIKIRPSRLIEDFS